MKLKYFLSVAILALSWSGSSFALLDDVKPEDKDQAFRLRLIAPVRNLPSHATRVPRVTVYVGEECKTRLFGLKTDKTKTMDFVELQKPLMKGTNYCVHYFMPYEDYDNEGQSFTILRGKMDAVLVAKTIQMRRIDVHNVLVERPDKTTYTVKGKFTLEALGITIDQEDRPLGEFETGLGIDVPGGFVYRVHVTAETEDGPMEYTKELDFRKE